MIIKKIFLSIIIIFFAGCTYIKDSKTDEIIIHTTGKLAINKENIFKKQYFLEDQKLNISSELDLENFINKEVIIIGLTDLPTIEKDNTIDVRVIDIALLNNNWKKEILNQLKISFNKPSFLKIINKKDRSVIYKNNEIFYVIKQSNNKEWKKKFIDEGTKIKINDFDLYRLKSGNQLLFYIPKYSIEIDYWGNSNDIHLFYNLIKSIKKENIQKKDLSEKNEVKIDKPNLENILNYIYLNSENSLGIKSKEINKISVFRDLLEITYLENNTLIKKLYSFDWSSILLGKIKFNHIVTWEKSNSSNWKKLSGSTPKDKEIRDFFNYNNEFVKKRNENKVIYFSSLYNFSIEYPEKMYYTKIKKNDNILLSLGFSFVPFYNFFSIDPEIILSVKQGKKDKREDYILKNIIVIPKSDSEYIEIKTSNSSLFYTIQNMADSITLYN